MATMEAQNGSFHPMEGGHRNPHAALDQEHEQHHHEGDGVQFADSFGDGNAVATHPEAVQHPDNGMMQRRERKSSKDYSHTDEWGKLFHLLSSSHPQQIRHYTHRIYFELLTNTRPTRTTDASKTVPSRFQQRKGSIFATPSSRDGHVERNLEKDAEFHKKHSKRFSFSKVKDKASDLVGAGGEGSDSRRRRSSAGHSSSG
ncbi:hypothetical protein PG997_008677 [Apiospora hydei]|uniref:Uncharacterized protein n=1 Tax=Apiospora hydei TaxID=1337664 RepID=A0ABR1WBH5_9PEZI